VYSPGHVTAAQDNRLQPSGSRQLSLKQSRPRVPRRAARKLGGPPGRDGSAR
jgi:hypothetical protein